MTHCPIVHNYGHKTSFNNIHSLTIHLYQLCCTVLSIKIFFFSLNNLSSVVIAFQSPYHICILIDLENVYGGITVSCLNPIYPTVPLFSLIFYSKSWNHFFFFETPYLIKIMFCTAFRVEAVICGFKEKKPIKRIFLSFAIFSIPTIRNVKTLW